MKKDLLVIGLYSLNILYLSIKLYQFGAAHAKPSVFRRENPDELKKTFYFLVL